MIRNGARASIDEILRFLKALEKVSVRAYLWATVEKEPRYTPQQNLKTIASHIVEQLRTL